MNNQCDNCGNPYLTADWEAALKERDARIKELEKALREIKGMEVCSGFREGFCKMKYIAKRALEEREGEKA
jgi:hypothetical protein